MDILSIIIIAIGLAMDCFAVSITKGVCVKKFFLSYSLKMAIMFGLFQGIMPLIGYFAGISFAESISRFDHWIAFGLLLFIGGKMFIESIKIEDTKEQTSDCDCVNGNAQHSAIVAAQFSWKIIFALAIATSIDALATGLIFVPFPDLIWLSVSIIGIVSFLFSLVGMLIGVTFGKRFKVNVNMIGGIILVAIGTKILIEHLFF